MGTFDVGMAKPGGGPFKTDLGLGSEVLLDTTVVSRGILGLEDGESGSSEEECGCVRLVTTGKFEGMAVVGNNESSGGGTTDDKVRVGSTVGRRGVASCLCTQDLRDHSVSSLGALSVLAGRLGRSPESLRTLEGRRTIIVPERSPSHTKGKKGMAVN